MTPAQVYSTLASSINTSIAASVGTHRLTVQARDSRGAYEKHDICNRPGDWIVGPRSNAATLYFAVIDVRSNGSNSSGEVTGG